MSSFMIDINLPESIDSEFSKLIPYQRSFINKMMKKGIITNYSLSADRKKLWVVINAESVYDVRNIIGSFPIFNYINFTVHNLLFHESNHTVARQLWLN